ncbi:hypothetical protein [Pusillimonas sp. T7-7]|uniref:hypothetical protein n=1 Tax=Pusillimonas sp. (strain T7-7) TaxID=1007105 RepID=UPI0013053FFC|nr:hypothetical protein [Pusillimonas sp. T7-7]
MDKKGKPAKKVKEQRSDPILNKSGWPTQAPSEGIKRASSVHDRKPAGRGAVRGR